MKAQTSYLDLEERTEDEDKQKKIRRIKIKIRVQQQRQNTGQYWEEDWISLERIIEKETGWCGSKGQWPEGWRNEDLFNKKLIALTLSEEYEELEAINEYKRISKKERWANPEETSPEEIWDIYCSLIARFPQQKLHQSSGHNKITIINLAAKRKALGYTQKEFAKASGISVKTLWKAEVEKPISKRVFTEILLTLFDLPTLMIDEQLD